MSTRRPKVPKPAADGLSGAVPRPAAADAAGPKAAGAAAARTAKSRPRAAETSETAETAAARTGKPAGAAAGKSTGPAAAATAGKPAGESAGRPAVKTASSARKPRQPKTAKATKPENASAARAAARQELAAEIRRDVPAGAGTGTGARSGTGTGAGAGAGTPASRTEPALQPVPAKSFSGRLLALGIVMVVITVLLAPSVRTYLQQRSEIAALQAEITREQQTGQELQETLDRWEDPAFIKAQARERIFLVMPGETRYLVKGEDGVQEIEEQASAEAPQDLEWVDALWDSVLRSATAP